MSKTKELKRRYGVYAKRDLFRLFWKPSSVRSGSPFSPTSNLEPVVLWWGGWAPKHDTCDGRKGDVRDSRTQSLA